MPVLAIGDPKAVNEFDGLLRRDRYAGLRVVGASLLSPAMVGQRRCP